MAIVKPSEMDFSQKNIIMIISGLPGVGKTTLALSAPDVLLIDTDEGMCRVKPAHRKDASICKTYEEVLADIADAKGKYKTIVIDTAGGLIDYMSDWICRHPQDFPKGAKNSGGISLQGFGYVKQEFLRLSSELRKDFNVVYLFHEQVSKNNESLSYELICSGSARTLVYQPADLAAHLFIQNGARHLGFTPTEEYSAKSAYGIKGIVVVPELKDGEPNDFLTKLFGQIRVNLKKEAAAKDEEKARYDAAIAEAKEFLPYVKKASDVPLCIAEIDAMKHGLTSEKEIKAMLKARMAEIGVKYDSKTKTYYDA